MSLTTPRAFDPCAHWSLSDQVSLRDEPFGALAYHHGNRRLVFLKSREMVALVRSLDDFDVADQAIRALVAPEQYARYTSALSSLSQSEVISEA